MNGKTLTRVGGACLLMTLGWLLVGGMAALFGMVLWIQVGYGVALGFTVGTLAIAAGSPPGDTSVGAALGAGSALAGIGWLLVGAAAYSLSEALLPAFVGGALLLIGMAVFARYDTDERKVDDWESDRSER